MLFQTACHTDQGPVRSSNQDAYTVKTVRSKGEEIALAAICDGMGGLAQGEVASARMVRGVEAWFRQAAPAILAGRLPSWSSRPTRPSSATARPGARAWAPR